MRARSVGLLLGAALFAIAAVGPGSALGKSGYFVEPPGLHTTISLPASHGYRITITNLNRKRLYLIASKKRALASYVAPGRISADGIRANLGRLGRIDLSFDPHFSKPERESKLFECMGKRSIQEVGSFDGQITFKGEQGFTSLSTRHAKGSVLHSFRRVCKWPPGFGPNVGDKGKTKPKEPSISITTLVAAARSHTRTTTFDFSNIELVAGPGEPGLSLGMAYAGLDERRGRIWVRRSAFADADDGSLLLSAPGVTPATATVTLPKPFSGSALYSAAPGSAPSWTGSLAVSLPGVGRIPLAGPSFEAALCRGKGLELASSCARHVAGKTGPERPVPPSVAFPGLLAQGSGSQSQAFWDARLSWSR